MAKVYSLIMAALLSLPAIIFAQPAINSSVLPSPGTNVIAGYVSYVDPGPTGASQTWDWTADTVNVLNSGISYPLPTSTPYTADFPGATMVLAPAAVAEYQYFKNSGSALQEIGINLSGYTVSYSNPEDYLHFPMNYNDSFVDPFVATLSSGGVNYVRSGTVTVTYDGYGTLALPGHTYQNTMRVHFHEVYQDSTDLQGFPYLIYYDNDQYIWYASNFPFILASTYTFTNNGAPQQQSYYAKSVSTGISNLANSDFKIYPQPAADELNIQLPEGATVSGLEVLDISGRQVMLQNATDLQGGQIIKLNTAGFAKGVYLAKLTFADGTMNAAKFIIE